MDRSSFGTDSSPEFSSATHISIIDMYGNAINDIDYRK